MDPRWLCVCVVLLVCASVQAQQPASRFITPSASDFSFGTDIAARALAPAQHAACGASRPFTHDAPIWTVQVQLSFASPSGTTVVDTTTHSYATTAESNELFVPYLDFDPGGATVRLNEAGRNYEGKITRHLGLALLEFSGRTLSEAGDVVNLLTENTSPIRDAFKSARIKLKIYLVRGSKKLEGSKLNATLLVGALYSGFDPQQNPGVLGARLETLTRTQGVGKTTTGEEAVLSAEGPETLSVDVDRVPLEATLVEKARQNVQKMAAFRQGSAPAGKGKDGTPPIFIVDEPCIQFSVAPLLNGQETTSAATFRVRYDFLSPKAAVSSSFGVRAMAPLEGISSRD